MVASDFPFFFFFFKCVLIIPNKMISSLEWLQALIWVTNNIMYSTTTGMFAYKQNNAHVHVHVHLDLCSVNVFY